MRVSMSFIVRFNEFYSFYRTRDYIFTICAEVSCMVLVIMGSPDFDVATLVFCKGIVTSPTITRLC